MRRRLLQHPTNWPLLSFAGGGGGSSAEAAAAAADVAARRLVLAGEAEFDAATQFPTNMAAKQLVALDWSTGGNASASHVVDLPFSALAQATQNFDAFNSLGSGASCDVFKGALFGHQVAVKRLEAKANDWAEQQFTAEMELLCKIAHQHVCRLLAFSTDGPQRCLVLELCAGGALNDRLACKAPDGQMRPVPLPWQQRVRIALHVLLALEYLHGLRPQMIHRQRSTRTLAAHSQHPRPPNTS
jgi:serine/threonine protein kinase